MFNIMMIKVLAFLISNTLYSIFKSFDSTNEAVQNAKNRENRKVASKKTENLRYRNMLCVRWNIASKYNVVRAG